MYDKDADIRAGVHNPTSMAEFQVFRSSDQPELGLPKGWYWDLPKYRAYKLAMGYTEAVYLFAYGPFDTSMAAYDHAVEKTAAKRRGRQCHKPASGLGPVTAIANTGQSATGQPTLR